MWILHLVVGIILVILGLIVLSFTDKAFAPSALDRPLFFLELTPAKMVGVTVLWVGLLSGGLLLLWLVNPWIAAVLVVAYGVLMLFGYVLHNEDARIRRIVRAYTSFRADHPRATEEDALKAAGRAFFAQLGWDPIRVDAAVDAMFAEREDAAPEGATWRAVTSVSDLAFYALLLERPREGDDVLALMQRVERVCSTELGLDD